MAGYIGNKSAVVSSGAERKKTFAITTTTTSLTGLSYTPNFVHVFHNGIRLVDGTDYTATNGTAITLTNAAESGDEVVVVSYATFTPADAYTKAEADDRYVNAAGDTMTGALEVNGNLTVDTNTLFVDAANNRVGMGTSIPSFNLSVSSAGATTVAVESKGATTLSRGYAISDGAIEYASLKQRFDTGEVRLTAGLSGWGGFTTFHTNGAERVRIDLAGRVTMPYQPVFDVAYSPAGYTAAGIVIFDTVFANVGGHYSTSTGRFTAPVSGSYLFYTTYIKNADTTTGRRRFDKNGSAYGGGGSGRHLRLDDGQAYGDNGVLQAIIQLAAGDYVTVDQFAGSSYGTLEYDYFGGYLIG